MSFGLLWRVVSLAIIPHLLFYMYLERFENKLERDWHKRSYGFKSNIPYICMLITSNGKIEERKKTQSIMNNLPGPLAPPGRTRPSRNITALSYSVTIWNIKHIVFIFYFILQQYYLCNAVVLTVANFGCNFKFVDINKKYM